MANGHLDSVLQHIRKLVAAQSTGTLPDRELLERFIQHRDEAAFATLVQRYGPMVLSVCRRVLAHVYDAEDACQATFLVLARKAASIRKKDSLGSWLHGVAYRAAANLKREVARRHAHEGRAADVPQVAPPDITWREVQSVLDEELQRLPKRFQAPLLLCYLEGKTRDEAAKELGWSLGTIRGRLERGRELLRARLTRRGLTLSAALLASMLTEHAVAEALPPLLLVRSVKAAALVAAGQAAATGIISTRVIALMEGGLKAMWVTKLKIFAATGLTLSLVGVGAGVLAKGMLVAQTAAAPSAASGEAALANAAKPNAADEPPAAAGKQEPARDPLQLARNQAESRLNLKKLGLAMHNHVSTFECLPAPAIYSNEGNEGAAAPGGGGLYPGAGRGAGPAGTTVIGGRAIPYGPGVVRSLGPDAAGRMRLGPAGRGPGWPRGPMPGGPLGNPGMSSLVVNEGKALLSWRVAILPYLGESETKLYNEFKLNEPWNSPHNKKLLARMPKIYAPPGMTTREPYSTYYQVLVGPHAAFEQHQALSLHDFTNGTSSVLLIVEGGCAVPWTKPADLHFAVDEPIPELGGLFPEIFHAAFADGWVMPLSKKLDAETLRRLIMRDGGQPVDRNEFKVPVSRREAELKQQNDRLKQQVERERSRLQALQNEKELLQEMAEDEGTELQKKEMVRLEQLLRKAHEEADQVHLEIQRLKGLLEKRPGERDKK